MEKATAINVRDALGMENSEFLAEWKRLDENEREWFKAALVHEQNEQDKS